MTVALVFASRRFGGIQMFSRNTVFMTPALRIFRRLLIAKLERLFCFWHFLIFLLLGCCSLLEWKRTNH
ncbi:MAG: hypothetical protein JWO45_726 [Spartobacteria bacterium]|nr:hypothetical protein [Spartobacteria bacterium]